ncbi:KH type 1 domain-containing protein [Chloropicon primus]|uniref:K Homology domain-containing protein n=2 Tax=Chloropicon primus TaxID=1764295 RepID=A0A5B8MDN3_9CHLO|nr:hypothetical protein A3770_02p10470 [Chloropicon primus]UPQ97738.1 KH type 1 domain-containing protein [Chloropicon primus]|eukprot:QDZ18529.1 hypothetical protein A3770_02p10470 [Chloropicon primus]
MEKCVPVSERKISLNIEDLPQLQPFASSPPRAKGKGSRPPRSSSSGGRSMDVLKAWRGGGIANPHPRAPRRGSPPPPGQGSWVAAKTQLNHSKSNLDSILPEDLNISWEFKQPVAREGKKLTLQVESSQVVPPPPVAAPPATRPTSPPSGAANPNKGLGATGKRPAGIGTENIKQEIVMAERGDNCVVLRVTLLAAGFVVGPNGASIHQIESVSGASIYSFNKPPDREVDRPTRQFHVAGARGVVQHAVDIICHAIQLYKDLAEGNHSNVTVKRLHKLDNVIFRYEPPPRSKVPFAAQVEYDVAELQVLQNTKGPKSLHGIREVREQLARRDEAMMRSNLPGPARQPKHQTRRTRRSVSAIQINLGEPDVQNHDQRTVQLIEDFDSILSISSSRSSKAGAEAHNLNVRAEQFMRTSVEKVPFSSRGGNSKRFDDFSAKISFTEKPAEVSLFPGRLPSRGAAGEQPRDAAAGARGPQRSFGDSSVWSAGWNQGGLYGIDSHLFRDI